MLTYNACKIHPLYPSFTKLMTCIADDCGTASAGVYRAQRIKDARFALRGFLDIARRVGAALNKQSGRALLREAAVGIELDDQDAQVAFGFQEPAPVLAALGMHHAFAVDPPDYSVICSRTPCVLCPESLV